MKILICFLFILSTNVMAQDINDLFNQVQQAVSKAGTAPKADCPLCLHNRPRSLKKLPLPIGNRRFNNKCVNFIKSDGTYGEWGKLIVAYLNKSDERKSLFFSPAMPGMQSSPKTCPNWGNMNNDEKGQFWVWMFASIAQVESSCDRRSVNTGRVPNPSDRPRGLFQLNTLRSTRSWRGPNCKFPSGAENVYNASNSIHCSLDIMGDILKGKRGVYKGNGKIFPTNSYWEKLRPNHSSTGGEIGRLTRMFPGCK